MAQRLLAVMGAVALVVLAVVVRRSIDDDGSGGSDGGDAGDGRLVLVCAADLAAACDAVAGVTVIRQDAAVTAAAIVDGDLPDGADGWVTTTAWTEVVEARSPGRIDEQEVLARSPVVVAVDPRRTTAVEGHCPEVLWRCLGDDAGSDWGSIGGDPAWGALKVGLPGADSATGLSVLASVASGYFGATDFASNDFDTSDFASWLGTLTDPSGKGEATPVRTLVTTRGKYTAVGDVAAAVGDLSADVLTPAPSIDATVVLVDLPGGDGVPTARSLRDALAASGWDATETPPATTLKPGVMAALYTLWTEVTR